MRSDRGGSQGIRQSVESCNTPFDFADKCCANPTRGDNPRKTDPMCPEKLTVEEYGKVHATAYRSDFGAYGVTVDRTPESSSPKRRAALSSSIPQAPSSG